MRVQVFSFTSFLIEQDILLLEELSTAAHHPLLQVAQSRLAAAIGDPANCACAAQVFRRSGLVSGRDDSGIRQRKGKGKRIIKVGDVHLRRALMSALYTLRLHQPLLRRDYHQLTQSKPAGIASVATARRANAILWATMHDQHARTLTLKRGASM